jgi:nucleotide-binding universal stress UspA family protein
MLARILLPVDFSDRCLAAARHMIRCAEYFHSEITLLHVRASGSDVSSPEFGRSVLPDAVAERENRARHNIDQYLRAEMAHLKVRRLLLEGDEAGRIVQEADASNCDLIAIPTHGRGTVRRLLLGSVTAKILHDAECPIWTTAHPAFGPFLPGNLDTPILCALDLSPQSFQVLEWALRMADACRLRLHVLHVVPRLPAHLHKHEEPGDWHQAAVEGARAGIARFLEGLHARAEVEVAAGDVLSVICEHARHLQAGLLVIGRSPSHGGLGRLRCHAYTIIREAPCPVVSV